MGLERRHNTVAYYRKERRGHRVVSTYVASGATAHMLAEMDAMTRRVAEEQRAQLDQIIAESREVDAPGADLDELVRLLTRAAFLLNGYHRHKGQWRKRRDQT